MRSPFARIGVAGIGVLALLGIVMPPAHARTVSTVVFFGTASLAAPIGYPCIGGGLPTDTRLPSIDIPGTGKCNPVTWTTTKGGGTSLPASQLRLPNRTAFGFGAVTCLMAAGHVLKTDNGKGATPVHTGTCQFSATGVLLGFCRLSQGHGTATVIEPRFVLPLQHLTYTVSYEFTEISRVFVLTGTVTKVGSTQTGRFVGVVQAMPPTPALTPGQSCFNKTARTLNIMGGGALVMA